MTPRVLLALALIMGLLAVVAGATLALAGPKPAKERRVVGKGQIRYCARGLCAGPERWSARALRNHRRLQAAEEREQLLIGEVYRLRAQLAAHQAKLRTLQARRAPPERAYGVWDRLAACESGGDWNYNGPSGFDGGVQFHPGTWSAYRRHGEPAYAYQATREQQITVAERVLAAQGWGAWPACSQRMGLR